MKSPGGYEIVLCETPVGFAPLSNDSLAPELSAVRAREAARGLSPDARVVMQYDASHGRPFPILRMRAILN